LEQSLLTSAATDSWVRPDFLPTDRLDWGCGFRYLSSG